MSALQPQAASSSLTGLVNGDSSPPSRIETVTAPPSYVVLAASQDSDDELQTLLASLTALRVDKLPIPGTTLSNYGDTPLGRSRPYIPISLRLQVFHPSVICRTQAPKKKRRNW
jgi:hypothetical protein